MTEDRHNKDLDELLGRVEAPAASDTARDKALTAAMAAFDAVQDVKAEQAENNAEGKKSLFGIQASEPQPRQSSREQRDHRAWSGLFKRRQRNGDPKPESQPMRTYSYRNRYAIAATALIALATPYALTGQIIPGVDNASWLDRSETVGASSLSTTPSVDNIPGELSSPFYESMLSDFNESSAQRALERGQAFVPVLQGRLQVDNDLTLPLPPASIPEQQSRNIVARSAASPEQERQRMALLREQESQRRMSQVPADSLKGIRLREQLLAQNGQPDARIESFDSAQLHQFAPVDHIRPIVPQPPSEGLVSRDRFEAAPINPFQQTKQAPISTFSVDVDTASYSFVRRSLRNGRLPPAAAVRIEEMVNYFDYNYPVPSDASVPFEPTIAVYQAPWNQNHQILHIGVKGYELAVEEKPRSNLTFLIDTSGSMSSPDKLGLLQQSLRMLVEQLNPEDTVAIVAYAGQAGTVLEPTPIRERGQILRAIDRLQSGGSTAGGEGIRLAYKLARQNFDANAVNQVIIGTDGDFNVGITDPNVLQDYIEAERASGIFLSVLGFGQGNYNDGLMQRLAQNGNGMAAYIDNVDEARKVLVEELTSTLVPIAKDVKIQIEFNPNQVAEYRLIGYESRMLEREDFDDDRVDAGEIGAGHTVTALYEIVPAGALVARQQEQQNLRYADAYATANIFQREAEPAPLDQALSGEIGFLKLRYKLPNEDQSQLITRPIEADELQRIQTTSEDVRFAAAVAGFAQLLRRSPDLPQAFDFRDVEQLARIGEGADPTGRRAEFISLIPLAETLISQGRYR